MTWKTVGFLTPLLLLAAHAPPGIAAPAGHARGGSRGEVVGLGAGQEVAAVDSEGVRAAGVVEGVLRVRESPPRRTVDRYGGSADSRPVQSIPPLVYLKGAAGSSPAHPEPATMAQRDTSFVPGLLVVPVGTTVRFPNEDPFFHNVFSYSTAARFDLGRYPRGESKDVRLGEPGIVKVYCEVHEPMRAAIVVVENGFWAQPDADGSFRIEGVPAGTYTLTAWHVDRGEVEREVRVPGDGVVRVELEI